jgi:hypothetical protein
MKTITFILVLLGEIMFLVSCIDCDDEIVHVQFSNPKVSVFSFKDTTSKAFSNYLYRFGVTQMFVCNDSVKITNINYASVWPGCEIQVVEIPVNRLDSIQVLSDRKYNTSNEFDVTDIFVDANNRKINDYDDSWVLGDFFLNEPPIANDTFSFTFKFFDSKGVISEFKLRKLIITK